MKVSIEPGSSLPDTEVIIHCHAVTDEIKEIIALLQLKSYQVTGWQEGEMHLLSARDILYIETVDKKTFLYSRDAVYETPLKLYELEARLEDVGFFRGGKSLIVNFYHIQSLRPDFGGRLRLTLSNGEACVVSRQYASTLRNKLKE